MGSCLMFKPIDTTPAWVAFHARLRLMLFVLGPLLDKRPNHPTVAQGVGRAAVNA
jgi:hypothetical protein